MRITCISPLRCEDVFLEHENTCKSAWTNHTSKLRVTLLAVSRSLGISEAGTNLKIGNKACRELPLERLELVPLRNGF